MIINLLIIAFTLLGVWSILVTKNGLEKLFQWVILAFILGYRTFEPISGLKLHSIEIFIYTGILRIIVSSPPKYLNMPINISLLNVFFVTFFFLDCLTNYHSDVLLEFKNSFILLLIFFIIQHIQVNKVYVIKLMKIYLYSATIISLLGIIEFLFPSFISFIFGYSIESQFINENILFNRLAFLFWGSHLAANLIPPIFPILLLLSSEKEPIINNKYFLTSLIIINLFAIYLSGNRISWLIITIFLIATIFQYRSSLLPYMKTYALLVTLIFVAYIYSQPVEGRYISTFKALAGKIDSRYDSSGGERLARAKHAITSIALQPLGTGWASQGWVHSDILQIGATVGIIPGAILLFSPLALLLRAYKYYGRVQKEDKTVFFTLGVLLLFVIISLGLNGNIFLIQCGVPLFLFWALSYGYCEYYYIRS